MCINTLSIRHMMRPFKSGDKLLDHAVPMAELLSQLQAQMAEFKALKDHINISDASSDRPSTVHSPPSMSDTLPWSSSYAGSDAEIMSRMSVGSLQGETDAE